MWRFLFIFLFLFPFALSPARAQQPELIDDPEFRRVASRAVDSLYNLNLQASRDLLEPWRESHPRHPIWTLFEGLEVWWQILSDLEDTSRDPLFFNLMGRADHESTRLLRDDGHHADALLIKAISNGYIARQYANRDQWISSMNHARRAYSAFQYLLEIRPDMPDLKMGEGLKQYYSEYLPQAYPIVKTVSWFLPEGDRQLGLRLLAQAADSGIFARAEARYFIANINFRYEENYEVASLYMEQLVAAYPNNNYYRRVLVRSYYRMDRYDRAFAAIDDALKYWEERNLPYGDVLREDLLTLKGRMLFEEALYGQAIPQLAEAYEAGMNLENPEGRTQHVIAGYILASCYLEIGNLPEARRYLAEITEMKASPDYREQAEELLKSDRLGR